jgi:hypothetical protein
MDWDKLIDDTDTKRRVSEAEHQQELKERQQKQDAVRKVTSDCLQGVVWPVFLEVKDAVMRRGHNAEVKPTEERNEKTGQSFIRAVEITVRLGGDSSSCRQLKADVFCRLRQNGH